MSPVMDPIIPGSFLWHCHHYMSVPQPPFPCRSQPSKRNTPCWGLPLTFSLGKLVLSNRQQDTCPRSCLKGAKRPEFTQPEPWTQVCPGQNSGCSPRSHTEVPCSPQDRPHAEQQGTLFWSRDTSLPPKMFWSNKQPLLSLHLDLQHGTKGPHIKC